MRKLVQVLGLLGLAGCLPLSGTTDSPTTLVPTDPFGSRSPAPPPSRSHFAPAATEVAMRVDRLGREILAANPQIGLKPLFATIGSPRAEIFHQGMGMVHVTEGLVRNCPGDAELAALLCYELAKMVAEREALAGPEVRNPEKRPPIAVPIGNAGHAGGPDLQRMAELAHFEKENPRTPRAPRPDPTVLARIYLTNAGFKKEDFDAAESLFRAAESNCTFEKQFKALPTQSPWKP